jgi:hypothetical protein
MRSLFLALILPLASFGQTSTIRGTIVNKSNGERIPFATIGLQEENIGINADDNGQFVLASMFPVDTLIISCFGFTTLKLPSFGLNTDRVSIELSPAAPPLKETVARDHHKWAYNTLNEFSNCGEFFVNYCSYMTQLAQHFTTPADNAMLSSVDICRLSQGILSKEKTKFRIRVYDIDPITKGPAKDLCEEVVEVSTKNRLVHIDLEPYRISIPNHEFFVAVEWLKIPYNEEQGEEVLPNGKKRKSVNYKPTISYTRNTSDTQGTWMLDNKNVWSPLSAKAFATNASIAATVKY